MGRPSKHNWEVIQEAYEKGFTKDEIITKFKISKKLLTDKINLKKWDIKSDVSIDINELKAKSKTIASNYVNTPDIADMFEARINTQIADNELITNNRKILRGFQGLITQSMRNKSTYVTAQDIRAGVGAIKDIETVANPTVAKKQVTANNQNVNQQNLELNKQIVAEALLEFDNEY